jgi:hypothetical protein
MTTSTMATTSSATSTLHLGYVYSNTSATTPVHSVHVITCVHDTYVVTAGGNRGENGKAPEGDAVTVTPQNRHLADDSEHATIYMMSLWKRTTKRLVHVGACTWCGWNQGSNCYKSSRWNPQKNII